MTADRTGPRTPRPVAGTRDAGRRNLATTGGAVGLRRGGAVGQEPSVLARLAEHPRTAVLLLGLAAFLGALLLRLVLLSRSYDIFVDEVTYLAISNNVAHGLGVTLHGQPFLLHPPLFFLIEAAFLHLFPPGGLIVDQVVQVRILNAFLGAVTAVVLLTTATVAARDIRAGAITFLLFAVDPFIVRINSRNLIETSVLLWVLFGYLVLLTAPRGPLSRGRTLVAGILFGLALLSKEMSAFLTLLPMAILWLTGWFGRRRDPLAVALVAAALYAVYPVGSVLAGVGPAFVTDKLSGLLRFLGVVRTTGFKPSGGPSFLAAIIANADVFATTYALIALGIPACAALLRWGDRPRRLLGVLGLSAYALLAYSIGFGTLEEQFFYYLVMPAILSVPVAWFLVIREVRQRSWSFPALARTAVAVGGVVAPVALAMSVAWSTFIWLEVHLTPDNGYQQLMGYMRSHIPNGAAIGVTSDPQQFVLQGYRIDKVYTSADVQRTKVSYVVVSTKQIQDGYVPGGAALYAWLRAHGQPMYLFRGATYGDLEIFRVRSLSASTPGG